MINEKLARKYCKEDISKIKNYDKAIADTTQVWHCHHMTETWWNCTAKDLIENECYYHRKACELIFLTHAEHRRLHKQGTHISEETCRKISEAMKGKQHSKETRMKMSESRKGHHHSEDTKRKMSESRKGKTPFKGHHFSEDTKRKLSEAMKSKTWKLIDGKRVYFQKEVK